jgi:hypothetical protein
LDAELKLGFELGLELELGLEFRKFSIKRNILYNSLIH